MVGLAESTVCQIVVEVCTAIIEELWSETVEIHFPKTNDKFKETLLDMDAEWQFPYAFVAIYGSHLPIKCSSGGQEAIKQYYNFKNFYSVDDSVHLVLLMLTIDLFGQVSELQQTLMTLPTSRVHPFGMILQAGKHCPDK